MSIQVSVARRIPVIAVTASGITLHAPHPQLKTVSVSTQSSSATGLRAGWWKGCAIPPRTIAVAALTMAVLCGHLATVAQPATAQERTIDGIVVRYQVGAPPAVADGRPWGAQCLVAQDRALVQRGRWIGAGMRMIRLAKAVTPVRAERIASDIARCPYVEWAEPELPVQVPLPRI